MTTITLRLVAFLALLCAALASAQSSDNSVNLHHLYLPMDGHGFYAVDDAHTLQQGEFVVGVNFSQAHKSLELGIPGDTQVLRLVRQLSVLDVAASVGLLDGVSLGLALPVVVDHDGRELDNLASDVRSGGFGAARIQLKATLYERKGESLDFTVGLKPFLTLPTGRADDYLSDNKNATGGAMFLADARFARRLRLGIEIGYEAISSDADLGDLEIVDRIRFGIALEVLLLRADEDALEPLPQSRWFSDPAWQVASRESWRGELVTPAGLARTYDAMVFLATAYGKDELAPRERALLDTARNRFGLSDDAARARERRVAQTDAEDLDLRARDPNERGFTFEAIAEMASCDGEVSWDEKLALKRVAHANSVKVAALRSAVEGAQSQGSATRSPEVWFGVAGNQRPLRVESSSSPASLAPGEEAELVVTVTNDGDTAVHAVELEGELPAGFQVLEQTMSADGYRDESEGIRVRFVGGSLAAATSVQLRLRIVAEAGVPDYRYTPAAYGLTTPSTRFAHTLALGGEIWGWTNSDRPFHNERERPIEAMGYLRYSHTCGFFLRTGIGVALNNGIGAPDVRYLVGGGFRF